MVYYICMLYMLLYMCTRNSRVRVCRSRKTNPRTHAYEARRTQRVVCVCLCAACVPNVCGICIFSTNTHSQAGSQAGRKTGGYSLGNSHGDPSYAAASAADAFAVFRVARYPGKYIHTQNIVRICQDVASAAVERTPICFAILTGSCAHVEQPTKFQKLAHISIKERNNADA